LNKKFLFFAISLLCILSFSGCSIVETTELTEDESDAIAIYTAKIISKYDKDLTQGIVYISNDTRLALEGADSEDEDSDAETDTESADSDTTETAESETTESDTSESETDATGETTSDTSTDTDNLSGDTTLTDVIGISGVTFSIDSTEIADDYTVEGLYSLFPRTGYEYFIVHVTAHNASSEDVNLDIASKGLKFSCKIGDTSVSSEGTLLLNDLATYQGTISAGSDLSLVMLYQFKPEVLSAATVYSIRVSTGDAIYRITQ